MNKIGELEAIVREFVQEHGEVPLELKQRVRSGLRTRLEGRRILIRKFGPRMELEEPATVTHVGFTFLPLPTLVIGMIKFEIDLRFLGCREFLRLEIPGDGTTGFLAILRPKEDGSEYLPILPGNIVQVPVSLCWQE